MSLTRALRSNIPVEAVVCGLSLKLLGYRIRLAPLWSLRGVKLVTACVQWRVTGFSHLPTTHSPSSLLCWPQHTERIHFMLA